MIRCLRQTSFRVTRAAATTRLTPRTFSTSSWRLQEAKQDSGKVEAKKEATPAQADGSSFPSVKPSWEGGNYAKDEHGQYAVTNLWDVTGPKSLLSPGGQEGAIATDLDQATGIERLELLGKLQGIDIYDKEPLDASRRGTMEDPIIVNSYDDFRYVGCTGSPAGSHEVMWLKPTVDQVGRCWECGSVYKLNYIGIPGGEDSHHH
jgi:cytochrome c oxidase subunit 5b